MNNRDEPQATDIFECIQEVNPQGYKWFTADKEVGKPESSIMAGHYEVSQVKNPSNSAYLKDKREWIISDAIPIGYPIMVERYNPLKHQKALFIKFANTNPEPDEILEFANQYGLLGLGESVGIVTNSTLPGSIMVGQKGEDLQRPLGQGELISTWQNEIMAMKQVLELWEPVNVGNTEVLKRFIHWEENDAVVYSNDPDYPNVVPITLNLKGVKKTSTPPQPTRRMVGGSIIASKQIHSERFKRIPLGDLIVPAKYYIQEQINEHLVGAVRPRLLWNINKSLPKLELFHVPTDLKGALWLQFAQAIHGDKSYHYCDQCGVVFELDPRMKGRASRKFCSNSCRTKALRNRQAEARRLAAEEKMKPAEIAKRLDSEIQTVRKWINSGKKK